MGWDVVVSLSMTKAGDMGSIKGQVPTDVKMRHLCRKTLAFAKGTLQSFDWVGEGNSQAPFQQLPPNLSY